MRARSDLSANFTDSDRDTVIRLAYDALLGREADPSGLVSQRGALTAYADLPLLVRSLGGSPEGAAHGTEAADLARFLDSLARMSQAPALDRAIRDTAGRLLKDIDPDQTLATFLQEADAAADPAAESGPALIAALDESGGLARLRLYAWGAAGQMLRVGREEEDPLFETRIEREFEYHEVQGLPASGQEDLVAAIDRLALRAQLSFRARTFCDRLAWLLGPGLPTLTDPALLRPPPAAASAEAPPRGTAPAGAVVDPYLRALFARHHHRILVDDAWCAHNRDRILAWYVNVWPDNPSAPSRIGLNPAQVAHLQAEVLDAGTLGHGVNRHIFHFARQHGLLVRLLESAEGLDEVCQRFLLSPAYRRLAHIDLVPARVLARLAAPVTLQGVGLNRFWVAVLARKLTEAGPGADGAAPRRPVDLSAREVALFCADQFAAALLGGLFGPLIPPEWFRLCRAGGAATAWPQDAADIAADPVWDSQTRTRLQDRRAAILQLLRDDPLDTVFGEGWTRLADRHETAARRARGEDAAMPVTLVGHGGGSGLSKNLAMFRTALRRAGIGYRRLEAETLRMQEGFAGEAGGAGRLARGLNLLAVNADLFTLDVNHLPAADGPAAANVGFFLWETTRAPQGHRSALAFADEIWVPSDFVKSVYDDLSGGKVRVVNVRKGIEVPQEVARYPFHALGVRPGDFVFLCIADFDSSIVRKNPLPAVRAFRQAFPDDPSVRLVLKIRRIDPDHWSNTDGYWTRVLEAIGDDGRISILSGDLPEADYWSLVKTADCMVSLHRAEGFGYGPAHAMAYGRPVIVTDFSGTRDFCTPGTAFPVPFEAVPVARGDMPWREDLGVWAEADVAAAAAAMVRVRAGGPEVAAITAAGQARIASDYAPARFAATIRDRIVALCG